MIVEASRELHVVGRIARGQSSCAFVHGDSLVDREIPFGLHLLSDDVEVPARFFAFGQNQINQFLEAVVDTRKSLIDVSEALVHVRLELGQIHLATILPSSSSRALSVHSACPRDLAGFWSEVSAPVESNAEAAIMLASR
ncbi:MAG: hypothetical protein M3545_06875 [Acidobacteriota bacterium]|nr:hypothetical protein [Acidobacteriota bacterium]